jgi:hypothetical protein
VTIITVMNRPGRVPAGTPITSPSNPALTQAQLLDPAPLPGRTDAGFLNGTAIVTGTTTGATSTAADVFVEPAENVLIGLTTAPSNGAPLAINGVNVALVSDARMPGTAVHAVSGVAIDIHTVAAGAAAAATGYLGSNGGVPTFYAFEVSAVGNPLLDAEQTTLSRVTCRQSKGELRGLGASTSTPATITLYRGNTVDAANLLGTVTTAVDGTFSFRFRGLATCPGQIRAENSNGSHAIADVALTP